MAEHRGPDRAVAQSQPPEERAGRKVVTATPIVPCSVWIRPKSRPLPRARRPPLHPSRRRGLPRPAQRRSRRKASSSPNAARVQVRARSTASRATSPWRSASPRGPAAHRSAWFSRGRTTPIWIRVHGSPSARAPRAPTGSRRGPVRSRAPSRGRPRARRTGPPGPDHQARQQQVECDGDGGQSHLDRGDRIAARRQVGVGAEASAWAAVDGEAGRSAPGRRRW